MRMVTVLEGIERLYRKEFCNLLSLIDDETATKLGSAFKTTPPSLQRLFYFCESFGITPQQFFDEGNVSAVQLAGLVDDLKKLDASTLSHISAIVRGVLNK